MMLKQLMNRQCGFWNPERHRDEMGGRRPTDEQRAEWAKWDVEKEKRKKVMRLTRSLTILSQVSEIIGDLDEELSPLAITALGNMAEQAASTLKLLKKDK